MNGPRVHRAAGRPATNEQHSRIGAKRHASRGDGNGRSIGILVQMQIQIETEMGIKIPNRHGGSTFNLFAMSIQWELLKIEPLNIEANSRRSLEFEFEFEFEFELRFELSWNSHWRLPVRELQLASHFHFRSLGRRRAEWPARTRAKLSWDFELETRRFGSSRDDDSARDSKMERLELEPSHHSSFAFWWLLFVRK